MRRASAALVALVAFATLPETVHACAVCFDANSEIRWSFLATTIFLSLLPLGMVAGTGLWIRRRMQSMEQDNPAGGDVAPRGTDADAVGGSTSDAPRS